jgi:hypothetical protein
MPVHQAVDAIISAHMALVFMPPPRGDRFDHRFFDLRLISRIESLQPALPSILVLLLPGIEPKEAPSSRSWT